MKIGAVIVTYNRKDLLQECIEAILRQSYVCNKIIVIDNNSTDGTRNMLEQQGWLKENVIVYRRLKKNIGGAGGFHEGIREAMKYDLDALWIMDDDTIPTRDALKYLIDDFKVIKEERVAFLASSVYGMNDEPMNVPRISQGINKNGYQHWYRYCLLYTSDAADE